VLRFIEDNWKLGRLGDGSMDAIANPINAMFNFTPATPPNSGALILSPTTGLVQ
jgi:phospholipase C